MAITIWDDIKYQFRKGDAILQLILVNVFLFLLVQLLFVPFFLMGVSGLEYEYFMQNWFYLPSDLYHLLWRPWTLLTYMFLHADALHLIFNMLLMYWFGRILSGMFPKSKMLPLYLLSGFAGGLLFVIAYNIFPAFHFLPPILGASASVMGIVLATATQQPRVSMNLFLVGRVELQYIALFLVLLDIIFIPGNNAGGRIAHLGGAFMGWFFMYQWMRGNDLSRPIHVAIEFLSKPFRGKNFGQTEPTPRRRPIRNTTPPHVETHEDNVAGQPAEDQPFKNYSRTFAQMYRHMSTEECIDAILDKIRRSGYHSLTEDEKAFLDSSSKNNR